jgi:nucleoside-diphosphate-sugar epimerase
MNVVLGENGEIARGLAKHLTSSQLIVVPRREFLPWLDSSSIRLLRFLEEIVTLSTNPINIHVSVGVTNPASDSEVLDKINVELPNRIIASSKDLPVRIITYGTVHEYSKIQNPYIHSKRQLWKSIENFDDSYSVLHLRLNTIYSDLAPKEHMFLGQLLMSLRRAEEFHMSSGNQIRQFHHIEDLVAVVDDILGNPMESRFFDVCGQEYLTLRTVAEGVLSHFGMDHLLRLGSMPENSSEVFQPPNLRNSVKESLFRPAISGLITTFHSLIPG